MSDKAVPSPTKEELLELRDELNRLYKNWVVINGRANRLVRKLWNKYPLDKPRGPFSQAYSHFTGASSSASFYGESIAKAIQAIDPRWSKTWANYHAERILEPNELPHPPPLSPAELLNPPSNMES